MSKRRTRRRGSGGRPSQTGLYVAGGLVALVSVAVVVLIAAVSCGGADGPSDEIIVPAARPADVPQAGLVLGEADAPVTVSVFFDFQCPFCRLAAVNVLPTIEEQYVVTGVAKIVAEPIAILGSESVQAGAAAACVDEQGEFWAYHDILFANQAGEQQGAFSDDRLIEMADALDLDADAFTTCLDSERHVSTVETNTDDARDLGITSTPSFLVNGVPAEATIEGLTAAIERATGQ